jgi:DNA helicase-2/ATP-dependent DNA helicase PcrA
MLHPSPLKLRPEQQLICNYSGGLMAVSAVPGSGKTFTLASLAVELITRNLITPASLYDDREILVVTFTTSAVDNIRNRIRALLTARKLPDAGYRVLTLHGLAHLILRQRPDLAGMTTDFQIDDELTGGQAMVDAVRWYTNIAAPDYWQSFLPEDRNQQKRERDMEQWRENTERIAKEITRLAKNLRISAGDLLQRLNDLEQSRQLAMLSPDTAQSFAAYSPFLNIGAAIYDRYEKILNLGGRLDFDDLIWRAIRALENDAGFCKSLGQRWWVILEDEAQDSTPLQETILNLIAQGHIVQKNWVRVGDPNQAIMTTFTASDTRFFREFAERHDVRSLPLSHSGRSAQAIIDMANWLAHWSANEHPEAEVRAMALSDNVSIRPTAPDDAQPNPPNDKARINLETFATNEEEAEKVALSAARFIMRARQSTCAILVPTNFFGKRILTALENIESNLSPGEPIYQDQLNNVQSVRNVADVLAKAIKFCSNPTQVNALIDLRESLIALNIGIVRGDTEADKRLKALLRSAKIERLLFPSPLKEPALAPAIKANDKEQADLAALATMAAKWVRASVLPIDQIMLTVAQDVLTRENDLAIAHSMAVSMRRYAAATPSAQLSDLANQLAEIAANRKKYLSNSLIESGFAPVPGIITVTTMHKAKGLEWDRVYLTGVDQQEFPHSASGNDWRGQVWFLGGRDPATEARKALEALIQPHFNSNDPHTSHDLMREARLEYIAERMRLLYVGITRAKTDLQISFSRKHGDYPREFELALPLRAWQG